MLCLIVHFLFDFQQALLNSAILIQESGSRNLRKVAYDRQVKKNILSRFFLRVCVDIGKLMISEPIFLKNCR